MHHHITTALIHWLTTATACQSWHHSWLTFHLLTRLHPDTGLIGWLYQDGVKAVHWGSYQGRLLHPCALSEGALVMLTIAILMKKKKKNFAVRPKEAWYPS